MDRNDLKEKLVLIGITSAIFLPLRLFVSQYVSDHWIGSLGIATLISFLLIILIKKERLGTFGLIFKKQITKTLWSKSAKFVIAALVIFMCYFGTAVLLVDRGNTIYQEDKDILFENIGKKSFDTKALAALHGPQNYGVAGLVQIQYLEYVFAISYAILNDMTSGWLVNLHLILFMEQTEMLGLLWFYKKMFKPIQVSA
jgi:hypothetical protein